MYAFKKTVNKGWPKSQRVLKDRELFLRDGSETYQNTEKDTGIYLYGKRYLVSFKLNQA